MNPRPLGRRALLKPADLDEGIWIPDSAGHAYRCVVVATGEPVDDLEPGEEVLVEKRRCLEIRVPRDGNPGQLESLWLVDVIHVLVVLDGALVT